MILSAQLQYSRAILSIFFFFKEYVRLFLRRNHLFSDSWRDKPNISLLNCISEASSIRRHVDLEPTKEELSVSLGMHLSM